MLICVILNVDRFNSASLLVMVPFLYQCPSTGLKVQGWTADDPADGENETYETVTCLACTRVHLVNPKTGKVLGTDED